jgi:hypothetical protein
MVSIIPAWTSDRLASRRGSLDTVYLEFQSGFVFPLPFRTVREECSDYSILYDRTFAQLT